MFKAIIILLLFTSNIYSYTKPKIVVQNIGLPVGSIIYDTQHDHFILVRFVGKSHWETNDNIYSLYVLQFAGLWTECWQFNRLETSINGEKNWKVIYNPELH